MVDESNATRAPENGAQVQAPAKATTEESVFSGDSAAQTGPTMGDHCTTDRPTPAGEQTSGEYTKVGGIDAYVTKPADYPHAASKLLLLLTGGTGLKSANNQLQADKFAAKGFVVVMPDQFENDPAPNSVDMTEITQNTAWLDSIKLRTAEGIKSFLIDMWLARHTSEKVLPILQNVVEGMKSDYADAVANGGGIYGVGYCFGAKYIAILAGQYPDTVAFGQAPSTDVEQGTVTKEAALKTAAIAHPTLLAKEDLDAVKVPIYFVAVEHDPMLSEEEVLTPGRRSLEKNKVEHEIQVYSGVPHGFAVYGDYDDVKIKQKQSQAFDQMLGWLQSH